MKLLNQSLNKLSSNDWFNKRLTRKDLLLRVYKILIFVLSIILLAPSDFYRPMKMGLDNSYRIAFHLAAARKMVYGEDIIFTYGPLSYFASRHPIFINKFQFLFLDLLVFLTAVFILIYAFKKLNTYTSLFLVFLCVVSLSHFSLYIYSLDQTMYLMLLFLIFYHREFNKFAPLLVGFIFSIIGFYLKLSSGVPILLTVVLYLIFSLIYPGKNSRRKVSLYTLIFLALYIASILLINVDIKKYLIGSYHIISGHNDAMFIEIGRGGALWGLFYLTITILLVYAGILLINFKKFVDNKDYLFMYFITGIFLLSLYKYGIVRYGPNLRAFFGLAPVALGTLFLFTPQWNKQYLEKLFLLALILTFPVLQFSYNHTKVIDSIKSIPTYIQEFAELDKSAMSESELSEAILPDHILEIIGDGSVDIFPWEISIIYRNGLNYSPRPVIQTYLAYDEYLDQRNYNFLKSADAPDKILFSMTDFELRYPFFDEPTTKLAILTNYKIIGNFDNYLLMEKRKNPIRFSNISSGQDIGSLDKYIEIEKSDNLVFINTDIEYSLLGKIVRAIYQPPRLEVTFQLEDGEERTYNAPVSIVTGDGLINKFVDTMNSAEYFFLFGGKFNENIQRIKFHSDQKWGFKKDYIYTLNETQLEHGKFDELQVVNHTLSEQITFQGFYFNEIYPDSIYIDLIWECKKYPGPDQLPMYADVSLNQGAVVFTSDASMNISCNPDTRSLITTSHRINLDSKIPWGPFAVNVNLFEDSNGELILSGSTTIDNVMLNK